jgi:hypothetical protein
VEIAIIVTKTIPIIPKSSTVGTAPKISVNHFPEEEERDHEGVSDGNKGGGRDTAGDRREKGTESRRTYLN